MKEQIVSYDTATLAKEKGLPTQEIDFTYFYAKPICKIYGVDEKGRAYNVKNTPKKAYRLGDYILDNHKNLIAAPTQSLLQKWLREEKAIDVIVEPDFDKNFYNFYVYSQDENDIVKRNDEIYSTYEEALEQGLQAALKLIRL